MLSAPTISLFLLCAVFFRQFVIFSTLINFSSSMRLSSERFAVPFPLIWKIKRAFGIGSKKKLGIAVGEVREFAKRIVREKLNERSSLDSAVGEAEAFFMVTCSSGFS
uniref:Uncharacterized protein n=1 Tax=Solanum lycopersicum TaxID=4081 RepID=A0A3Q7ED93_SOLLC